MRFLKSKKGQEATNWPIILLVIGVVALVLIILWQVGFWGKMMGLFGMTEGYELEAAVKICEQDIKSSLVTDFCYYKAVKLPGASTEIYANCRSTPLYNVLGAGKEVIGEKCDKNEAHSFCLRQNTGLGGDSAKLSKIMIIDSNDWTTETNCNVVLNGVCGNGKIDGSEQCDGADLGGKKCTDSDYGYLSGELSCDSSCKLVFNRCMGN